MMINKRLIAMAPESKRHIKQNVVFQMMALLANIVLMFALAFIIQSVVERNFNIGLLLLLIAVAILLKAFLTKKAVYQSYLAAKDIKLILRNKIYNKLLVLGSDYSSKIATAEVVQASVEGVEQLETYFGSYLPQFFYSLLAPVILFIVLAPISFISALALFLCVPLIPLSIVVVQKIAKKILAKYWGQYVKLGSSFLENLQGLTTLKIYQADQAKHDAMNVEAEHFRKVTMKVLTMQLNSITLMDWVAYGGSALGIAMAVTEYSKGNIQLWACFLIIMLSADFFLPLRLLGSYFHIAMNGMAASEKIFRLLDLEEPVAADGIIQGIDISIDKLDYAYNEERSVLSAVNLAIPTRKFVAIVGESGSGKSTIAKIIAGENKNYQGSIKIGGIELNTINQANLKENIVLISNKSYIFKGRVRDNLLMAKPNATDEEMWKALTAVNLADFLKTENGLDTELVEAGANFSGGQRQRLAVARALLLDPQIYIFDEATSNIDVESEDDIIQLMHQLAQTKAVILISHRLANVTRADMIYVIETGKIVESGQHQQLLAAQSTYAKLWQTQSELEAYRGGQNV